MNKTRQWISILWEGWAALVACTAAVLVPGSPWARVGAVVWPGLALAAAVPTAWALWGLLAEPALPAPPDGLLEERAPTVVHVERAALIAQG